MITDNADRTLTAETSIAMQQESESVYSWTWCDFVSQVLNDDFPLFLRVNEMDDMVTDRRDEPQTDFVYCCGAITEVLKFGSCQLHSGHKVLFLILPGEFDHCTPL